MESLRKRTLLWVGALLIALLVAACGGSSGGGGTPGYTVSGTVLDADGNPLEGVTLTFTDMSTTVETDTNGKWTSPTLTGEVTVVPVLAYYTFEPESKKVTRARSDVDFTGTPEELGLSLVASQSEAHVERQVTLSATITGADASGVAISWTATGADDSAVGGFDKDSSASGETVTWTAPVLVGKYTIRAVATVEGKTLDDSVEIDVIFEPVRVSIEASDTGTSIGGGPIELTARVTGSYADMADIHWTATGGALTSDTDRDTEWHPPAVPGVQPGTYTISVEVSRMLETDSATTNLSTRLCDLGEPTGANAPCVISNVIQLQAMQEHLNGSFELGGNINASPTKDWTDEGGSGKGFVPVGTAADSFRGTFDGAGFEITGLHIERPDQDHVGLFGYVRSATIENVRVVNVYVKGRDSIGALSGVAHNGSTIENVHSDGFVSGRNNVGGLIGVLTSNGVLDNGSSGASVDGTGKVGGLVGDNIGSMIEYSHATGVVSGSSSVGGLVGFVQSDGEVVESFSTGEVTGTGISVGGLVGKLSGGSVDNSHSTGEVSGTRQVGGLVGESNGTIWTSHSTGDVTGEEDLGGLVGYATAASEIETSYSTSDVTSRGGSGDAVGGLVGRNEGSVATSFTRDSTITGGQWVGGLIGANRDSATVEHSYSWSTVEATDLIAGGLVGLHRGTITQSYSVGSVSSESSAGGLVGTRIAGTTVTESFWNEDTAGVTYSNGGSRTSDEDMKKQATFEAQNWDFDENNGVWMIDEDRDYPDLRENPRL